MKTILQKIISNGIFILLIIATLYIIFLRECKTTKCPPKGQVLVSQIVWDSIQKIANMPPIIHYDTIIQKGKTVYITSVPVSKPTVNPKDTSIKIYNESLLKKDIDVTVGFSLRGELLDIKWQYNPIVNTIIKTVTEYVPKIVDRPIETPRNKLFISGNIGGNDNAFLYGGSVDFITKKNTELGYIYQRYGNVNFHSIKVGIIISFKKKGS
jgi:hypothetical protein